jgi:hypothetical protein
MSEGFIPPHGDYHNLLSYRKAEIVYDATVYFCDRYIDRYSRTRDQMVQAARSGKQNIIEGSLASGTSKESEIKRRGQVLPCHFRGRIFENHRDRDGFLELFAALV